MTSAIMERLDPPKVEWLSHAEVAARQERAYAAAMAKFLRGEWRTEVWDSEQVDFLLNAVRVAVSGIALTPAEKWDIVQRAALRVGGELADNAAGEI